MNKDSFKRLFSNFDRQQFADWLWRGLYSFYNAPLPDRGSTFDNAGHIILEYESICEGLAVVYEELVPSNRQLAFRQAIGDVLREKSGDNSELVQAFQDLIYLIIRIKAYESLSSLLPSVGNGVIGKQYPEILYETIAALASLAPSDYAYKTATNLINSANFDDGYLFEAIKVLVECKPNDTAKVVLNLEPRLTQLYIRTKQLGGDEYKIFCDVAKDWAEFLLNFGTTTWLSEIYEKASHSVDQKWLFNFLFANDTIEALFNWDGRNRFWITYRGKIVPVRVSGKDYHTRRMLLHSSETIEFSTWIKDPKDKTNQILLYPEQTPQQGTTTSLANLISAKYSRMLKLPVKDTICRILSR